MPRAPRARRRCSRSACTAGSSAGRAASPALARFIDYVQEHDRVWMPTPARHRPPLAGAPSGAGRRPRGRRRCRREAFVARLGGVFEHSPWIAERAFALELGPAHDTAVGLGNALARAFRSASEEERLGVLTAHPDLAGKLAAAKRLTAESTAEQAGAGLDALTDAERAQFTALNDAYQAKFGFPFIIAVRDHDKAGILAAFERRARQRPRHRVPHRLRPGRADRRPQAEGHAAMKEAHDRSPRATTPRTAACRRSTELHTGRAVFTEAYAVIPRGVFSDIVTSALPHLGGDAGLDHRAADDRLCRDLLAVHHGGRPRRRQRPAGARRRAPRACSSSPRASSR